MIRPHRDGVCTHLIPIHAHVDAAEAGRLFRSLHRLPCEIGVRTRELTVPVLVEVEAVHLLATRVDEAQDHTVLPELVHFFAVEDMSVLRKAECSEDARLPVTTLVVVLALLEAHRHAGDRDAADDADHGSEAKDVPVAECHAPP